MLRISRRLRAHDQNTKFEGTDKNGPVEFTVFVNLIGNTIKKCDNSNFDLAGAQAVAVGEPKSKIFDVGTISRDTFISSANNNKFGTFGV